MATTGIPESIGNFRIVSKIGQGGMGAVYRAVHGTLERPVALKILPAELAANAEYVARFLREARTVAQLRHENVVQVYDAGEQNGQYYIAMELVDGSSLQKHADEQPQQQLSEAEGLELLLQAAKGLAAAHAKGLVHRDIKPENMLLGKDKILRLVDFGLVMESASTSQLTATGACLGTPMYMSPEQADGEHADARTDLYSLGASFFRVFTGQPPFNSGSVMNLLFKHKFEPPPDPLALRRDLSQNVRNLLLHLLAKRREDRPASAQAVVELLEGLAKGKPVPPPPPFVPAEGGASPTAFSSGLSAQPPLYAPSRKGALAGVFVLLAILAAGIVFAVARHAKAPTVAPPIIFPPEKATTLGASGSCAKGDEAFSAGRYAEALESYTQALAAQPGDTELRAKTELAGKAVKFEQTMQAAGALEEKGELEAAAAKYEEAAALETGTTGRAQAERVRAALARIKETNTAQRNAELDALSAKAQDAEKTGDFEGAAEHYARAAGLADGNVKVVFADKARECRCREYQAKALAAEEKKDYGEAKGWYAKAQGLKDDPLVAQKVEALEQKMKPATDAAYETAMREGQKALEAGDLAKGRSQFNVALSLKPANPGATAKLTEVDARELLAKADNCRTAGNRDEASRLYNEALQKCPALAALVNARLQALAAGTPIPPVRDDNLAGVSAKVDDLVLAQKNTEALAEIAAALRLNPESKDLKILKDSLENMLACEALYPKLQAILKDALGFMREIRDIDDDDLAREWRDNLEKLRDRFTPQVGKPRQLFLAHNHQGVQAALTAVRAGALELASQLSTSADGCDRKADKAEKGSGLKTPFGFSLGGGGDKKKAGKYRNLCESIRKLAEQARAPDH
ncbi:MAG: protein kinase [Planctomycetota bacterium]